MATRRRRELPPHEALRALEAGLREQGLARGYVLRGEERYFREKALEILQARAVRDGYEICMHDGAAASGDFQLTRAIDDLSGAGLFSARRWVVLRNVARYLRKEGTRSSPLARAVKAFLADPGDPGSVCIPEPSLRADHECCKAVVAAGGVVLSLRKLWGDPPPWKPDPREAEVCQWALGRARELGVRLRPDDAVYLCAATGSDLFAIEDELEALSVVPDAQVRQAVGWNAAASPWDVAEHVVSGNRARALVGIQSLFRSGFQDKSGRRLLDSSALGAMLTASLWRAARQSWHLGAALQAGLDEREALADAGVQGAPRTVERILERTRRRSPAEWRALTEEILDLDRRAKTGASVGVDDFVQLALGW